MIQIINLKKFPYFLFKENLRANCGGIALQTKESYICDCGEGHFIGSDGVKLVKQVDHCKLTYKKGFSLIELLVVVAIIGILAAVGIVAYSGYTAAAKKNATLTSVQNIIKSINAEKAKCDTGVTFIQGLVDKNGNNIQKKCADHFGIKVSETIIIFQDHFQGKKFKNPYNQKLYITEINCTIKNGNRKGCINFGTIASRNYLMHLQPCYADPCTSASGNSEDFYIDLR